MQHKQNRCNCVCVCAWDHYLFRLIFHFHFFMWSTLCSCMKSAIQRKLLLLCYLKLIHTSDMSHCNEERKRERCYIMLVWPPWWHQKVQNPTTTVSAWQLRYFQMSLLLFILLCAWRRLCDSRVAVIFPFVRLCLPSDQKMCSFIVPDQFFHPQDSGTTLS